MRPSLPFWLGIVIIISVIFQLLNYSHVYSPNSSLLRQNSADRISHHCKYRGQNQEIIEPARLPVMTWDNQSTFVFLKTHKTGSSTLTGILWRQLCTRPDFNSKNCFLPSYDNPGRTWNFAKQEDRHYALHVSPGTGGRGAPFDVWLHHVKLDKNEYLFNRIVKASGKAPSSAAKTTPRQANIAAEYRIPQLKFLSIVRRPAFRFQSAWYWYKHSQKFKLRFTPRRSSPIESETDTQDSSKVSMDDYTGSGWTLQHFIRVFSISTIGMDTQRYCTRNSREFSSAFNNVTISASAANGVIKRRSRSTRNSSDTSMDIKPADGIYIHRNMHIHNSLFAIPLWVQKKWAEYVVRNRFKYRTGLDATSEELVGLSTQDPAFAQSFKRLLRRVIHEYDNQQRGNVSSSGAVDSEPVLLLVCDRFDESLLILNKFMGWDEIEAVAPAVINATNGMNSNFNHIADFNALKWDHLLYVPQKRQTLPNLYSQRREILPMSNNISLNDNHKEDTIDLTEEEAARLDLLQPYDTQLYHAANRMLDRYLQHFYPSRAVLEAELAALRSRRNAMEQFCLQYVLVSSRHQSRKITDSSTAAGSGASGGTNNRSRVRINQQYKHLCDQIYRDNRATVQHFWRNNYHNQRN